MKTRKRRTIEKKAKEYSKKHNVSVSVADLALWKKGRNPKLTDKQAIKIAKGFWKGLKKKKVVT